MEVLSTDSLEKLRQEAANKPQEIISEKFDDIVKRLDLVLVQFNADISLPTKLLSPSKKSQKDQTDFENCKAMHEQFTGLTAATATDERLWVTLCFREYAEYVRERWPIDKEERATSHVSDHWFAKTSRNRMRDNAISRLWWIAHIASRVSDASIDEVLEMLFFDSDYRQNLLDRTSSANSANVVAAILSISKKALDEEGELKRDKFKRDKFRIFMKKVDFIGRRTALPSMSVDDIEELLSPMYHEAYKDN